jgi:hypothetical protein
MVDRTQTARSWTDNGETPAPLRAITAQLEDLERTHGLSVAEAMARFHIKAWDDAKREQLGRHVAFFHGGAPGLTVGDKILPFSVTGTERVMTRFVHGTPEFDRLQVECRDHVYFTPAQDLAEDYAAVQPDGSLYQVRPDGEFEADPDCGVPGLAWRCTSATIVAVPAEVVRLQRALTVTQIEALYGPAPLRAWLRR